MKNKRNFLIKQSLKKKMGTKWFKITNVLLLVVMIAVINLDKIVTYFGGDFENVEKIYVIDNTSSYDSFVSYFQSLEVSLGDSKNYEVEITTKTVDDYKDEMENDGSIVIELNPDENEYMKATITSFGFVDTMTSQILTTTLNSVKGEYALKNSNIDSNELQKIMSPISVDQINIDPEANENGQGKETLSMVVMLIFILPLFFLIILLVQMLGAEINDEKTSRSMEIIISNVSPKTHFVSKIIAATLFVLSQAGLLFLYGLIGLGTRILMGGGLSLSEGSTLGDSVKGIIDLLKTTGVFATIGQAIPLILILIVFTLLAFAIFAGVLASMTTSIEDYQQLQTPIMLIIMAGYYIGIMASQFEGALFIKVFSYIPFFSAMIAPVIYVLGQTTIIDLLVSIVICGGTCFLLFKYGIRIYKVGILNYSSKDLWKKMFKSLKEKE